MRNWLIHDLSRSVKQQNLPALEDISLLPDLNQDARE
jgi:hypothetical protein